MKAPPWSTTRSGETTFEDGIDALRRRGFMVLYGMASGPAPAYDPQRLQARSLYITRPGLPAYTATREELLERAGDVLGWIADGSLDIRIGARYPLEDAAPRARGSRGPALDRKVVADSLMGGIRTTLARSCGMHDDVTPTSGLGQLRTSGTFARHV